MISRHLIIEFIRVCEMTAITSAQHMGLGNQDECDLKANETMRNMLNSVDFQGEILLAEDRDTRSEFLKNGESVGSGFGAELELVLEPIDGSAICAKGGPNSISVLAIGEKGHFFRAPETYMNKIATSGDCKGVVDLKLGATENIKRIAEVKKCRPQDLTVAILNRPRHKELISEIRKLRSRITLIEDGDISAAIATCKSGSGVDVLLGSGGAKEGVITAAAMSCMGGEFQGAAILS